MVLILAQIAGVIGWLLLLYSYYKDDIEELLFVQIFSSVFYCLNYLLLGAYSGLIVCLFELIKGIGYYKTSKDNLIFLCSVPVYIVMAFFSYDGLISLLPVLGSLIDGFSLTKNKNTAVVGSIISNILWVIYDIAILAYVCAITDGLVALSSILLLIFGYSRLIKTNKLRIVQSRAFSRNIYNFIDKLDKDEYGDKYTWDFDYSKSINSKSKDSLYLIKYDDKVVGYLNYFIISNKEMNKIIDSETFIEKFDEKEILEFKQNNNLIIDSINIKKDFQNDISIDLIIKRIKKIIIKNYKLGYKINNIISVAVTSYEKKALEKAGFVKNKEYLNGEYLYILDKNNINCLYLNDILKKYRVISNKKVSQKIIDEMSSLDRLFFKDKYIWDSGYQYSIFKKNKNSLITVLYENKLVGYVNYLTITKKKYLEMVNSEVTIDDFELAEIKCFQKNRKNYITLNSIVINPDFQNGVVIKLLTDSLKKNLRKMHRNGYIIGGINAIAVSEDGKKFLENLDFIEYGILKDGNTLYVLENENIEKYFNS